MKDKKYIVLRTQSGEAAEEFLNGFDEQGYMLHSIHACGIGFLIVMVRPEEDIFQFGSLEDPEVLDCPF